MLLKLLSSIVALFVFCCSYAQSYYIEQYLSGTNKVKKIKVRDKVFFSFNQPADQVLNRPNTIFINSKDTSNIRIFVKARITGITDSSIQFKDINVGGNREIRLAQLTGIRKITLGKQILRTTLQCLGILSIGYGLANTDNLWTFLTTITGGSTLLEVSGDHFSKKYIENWKIRVVALQ